MKYKHLANERKEYIDILAEKLRQDYCSNLKVDFQSLAKDNNINLLKTGKIIGGLAVRCNGKDYAFIGAYSKPYTEEYLTAHEIGHRILKHSYDITENIKENEADYFAERIIGKGINNMQLYFEMFCEVLRHPIKSSKYSTRLMEREVEALIDELEAKTQG